ncbi:ATXR2, partial [Symbiodinium necroappetens]
MEEAEASEWQEMVPAPPPPDVETGGSSSSCAPAPLDVGEAETPLRHLLQWLRDEAFIEVVAEWSWDVCMEFPRDGSLLTQIEHPLRYTE